MKPFSIVKRRALAATAVLMLLGGATGGCVSAFCAVQPLAPTAECLKAAKEHDEWLARPFRAPESCPGTSVWTGVGCTTPKNEK